MSNNMKMEKPVCPDLTLAVAQTTNIGERNSNQDALGMVEQEGLACFVVSDGAGGHHGGEIAANIVVQAVIDSFIRDLSFGSRALQSYIDEAIAKVAHGKTEDQSRADMSATVAAVLIDRKNRCALWGHMGDTRVYVFRNFKVFSVTKDHTVVQQLIDAGYCKPEEARTNPQRSTLFAAIGAEGDIRPAVSEDTLAIEDGDVLLMCSDGFWEWVPEVDMEQALAAATDVNAWLDHMIRLAEVNSSASAKPRDNFTAFALWLGERRPAAGPSISPNDSAQSEIR
jgi:serine/threonine protein phosphatase PrpC